VVSAGERRAFLIGMTLNELVFLLFFLLLIISAISLKAAGENSRAQADATRQASRQLQRSQQELDQAFKKLVLQEAVLSRLEQASAGHSREQLDDFFQRLVEDRRKAGQLDQALAGQQRLREHNQALQPDRQRLTDIQRLLDHAGLLDDPGGDPTDQVKALIDHARSQQQRTHNLEGQLSYLNQRLQAYQGSGVDHPPCWANANSGTIDYLFTITLLESGLQIERAWSPSRDAEARQIPGVAELIDRHLDRHQFLRLAKPLYDWSVARECRHFVRVRDDPATSKRRFKQGLRTVEAYFYKLMVRGK